MKGCRDILDRQQKKFIPDGLAVQFYFWRVPPECEERFHDRFIITERMGIQSSYGLDTGTGKTVMTMLDATILDNVWRLFDPGQSPFRLVKNISGGARELR